MKKINCPQNGVIIGIDGGGTKSHLAVFDQNGHCLGVSLHGPLNHESLEGSFPQLEEELTAFIQEGLAAAGVAVSDVIDGVFGLAGVDTKKQQHIISQILRRIGLTRFTLCNDAYLGVAAGCPNGTGICAINGTGSTMAAIDHSGMMVQVGGIGELSNDCGGSGWYSTQLFGAVYDELFKGEAATLLTRMLLQKTGVTDPWDYTETLTAGIENGSIIIPDLNRMVFEAAHAGDAIAFGILEQSAKHYAGGIAWLIGALKFPPDLTVPVTLAGSVFVKEPIRILPQLIEEGVRRRLPGRAFTFLSLDAVPVAGAVLWAFRNAGIPIDAAAVKTALAAKL